MEVMTSSRDEASDTLLDAESLSNTNHSNESGEYFDSQPEDARGFLVAIEAHKEEPSRCKSLLRRFRGGWRTGVAASMVTAFVVMVVNISVLCWVYAKLEIVDGVAIAFEGSCDEMSRISTWSHLAINALSTLLLGASNMGMQCLSAPTRAEVDKSHSQGSWLTIGVQNVGNLGSISDIRVILWALLGLSSIPLHLLYNSVLFTSQSSTDYVAVLAAENFITGGYYNYTRLGLNNSMDGVVPYDEALLRNLQQKAMSSRNLFVTLNNSACIEAYNNPVPSKWHNVILVSNSSSQDSVYDMFYSSFENWSWLCGSYGYQYEINCDVTNLLVAPEAWTITERVCPLYDSYYKCSQPVQRIKVAINYCLAETTAEHCRVEISPIILLVVLLSNVLKLGCLLSTLLINDFIPLITVGDAIASFLDTPDMTTLGEGTVSALDVSYRREDSRRRRLAFLEVYHWQPPSRAWKAQQYQWCSGVSHGRWLATTVLSMIFWIAVGSAFVYLSANYNPGTTGSLWTAGFGTVSISSIITTSLEMSLTGTVLVTNTPQLLLSINYFLYNSLYTSMLLTAEANSYALHRKSLRVSDPRGTQRSTYYLQLPYRYATPLMIVFGALHWAFSQSIFLVQFNVENADQEPAGVVQACGWSAPALATSIGLGLLTSLALGAIGRRKYAGGMPIIGSCSLAIAAACHAPPGDDSAALKNLMYGATWRSANGSEYAGFSSKDVRSLKKGVTYGQDMRTGNVPAPVTMTNGQGSVSLHTWEEMGLNQEAWRNQSIPIALVQRMRAHGDQT
ncbi:hypothetical protein MMC13_005752 [Lambiella insularis]|nr:hypothetical protein [Lambiella insularis]